MMLNRTSNKSDFDLWELLRQSNKEAFSILYQRHIQALINFGLKHTQNEDLVKDSLQDLFIEIWNKRSSLTEVTHVKVYLFKAFRYKLLRALSNSQKSQTNCIDGLHYAFAESEIEEEENILQRKKILNNQIQQLPERQKEIIYLRYFHNLKNEEIADILNMNYQSVANLLHRAIKKLRQSIPSRLRNLI
ncbi:MAG: sigma-70 family RNA polymerase sigma factor [Saprospiraceae bacterium]